MTIFKLSFPCACKYCKKEIKTAKAPSRIAVADKVVSKVTRIRPIRQKVLDFLTKSSMIKPSKRKRV